MFSDSILRGADMVSKPIENPIVAISVKVYQAFLAAYPARFQQEYGSDMVQVFQDGCTRSIQKMGLAGIINYWMLTLLDFLVSVISEHSQKDAEMAKSKYIKLTGIVLMLGGFLLFVATWGSHSFWNFLFSIGLERTNQFNHPVLSWLGLIVMAIGLGMLYKQAPSVQNSVNNLAFSATAIGIVAGMIFTLTLVIPKLNFGPILAFPMVFLLFSGGLGVIVISAKNPDADNQAD